MIQDNELALILSWRNAPAVRSKMYTRHEISMAEHTAWWERTKTRADQHYRIYEHEGQALGVVGFTEIDQDNKTAAWAFYASPDAPRGTGSKMEFLALEHAFGVLGLHKLYCEVLDFNMAVVKLHHKFGFQTEGLFREQHKVGDSHVNIYRLGILNAEWQEKRSAMQAKLYALTGV